MFYDKLYKNVIIFHHDIIITISFKFIITNKLLNNIVLL